MPQGSSSPRRTAKRNSPKGKRLERPRPTWQDWLTGDAAAGGSISAVLHAAAILILSITLVERLQPHQLPPVVIASWQLVDKRSENAPLVDTVIQITEVPVPTPLESPFQLVRGLQTAETPTESKSGIHEAADPRPSQPDHEAESPSTGGDHVPHNAVHAGHFSAWWIPTAERYGEDPEPGQLPRVGQDYRIVIRIRVPEGRRFFNVKDLSGEIVGTDGYKQFIPDRAWTTNTQGELIRVPPNGMLPVNDGAVEIAFKVQGAGKAGVRDVIRIQSKLLNDEQRMLLTFQPKT